MSRKAPARPNHRSKAKPVQQKLSQPKKAALHPRNRHQQRYDFDALTRTSPELKQFVRQTPKGNQSIDFTDPIAVKALNRALLMLWYQIEGWDIPEGYLCPPIPGRADYIHNLADLLAASNHGKQPKGSQIRAMDVGCGANCIYPLIGHSEYRWRFVGAEIDPVSLASAERILAANPSLQSHISLRQQPDKQRCFEHVLEAGEFLDLTLCNPPFHDSPEQMVRGTQRKWKNLGKWDGKPIDKDALNFGGQSNELWCEGGEVAFISRMMKESQRHATQVYWFTSLVSRQAALPELKQVLKRLNVTQHKVVTMAQGQKSSRFIAWTFLTPEQQAVWRKLRWAQRR